MVRSLNLLVAWSKQAVGWCLFEEDSLLGFRNQVKMEVRLLQNSSLEVGLVLMETMMFEMAGYWKLEEVRTLMTVKMCLVPWLELFQCSSPIEMELRLLFETVDCYSGEARMLLRGLVLPQLSMKAVQ